MVRIPLKLLGNWFRSSFQLELVQLLLEIDCGRKVSRFDELSWVFMEGEELGCGGLVAVSLKHY